MTGLRPGELLALGWDELDADAGEVRVRYGIHAAKDAYGRTVLIRAELKNEWSKRTIDLDWPAGWERLRPAIAALRREQRANRLRFGPHYTDSGAIFCTPDGRLCWRQTVNAQFKQLCADAGIGDDWTVRELRHTFCSQAFEAGGRYRNHQ